jgi:hypothetical protein
MTLRLKEGATYKRRDGKYTTVRRDYGEDSLLRWIGNDGTRYHESGIVAGNMLPGDRLFRPTDKDIMKEVKPNA